MRDVPPRDVHDLPAKQNSTRFIAAQRVDENLANIPNIPTCSNEIDSSVRVVAARHDVQTNLWMPKRVPFPTSMIARPCSGSRKYGEESQGVAMACSRSLHGSWKSIVMSTI